MAELNGDLHVACVEGILDRHLVGLEPQEDFGERLVDIREPPKEVTVPRRVNGARVDFHESCPGLVHHPVAGRIGAGVKTENAQPEPFSGGPTVELLIRYVEVGVGVLDVVVVLEGLNHAQQVLCLLPFQMNPILRDHGDLPGRDGNPHLL